MTNKYEKRKYEQGYDYVIGVDEVGRGSLAGPVVAAAIAFRPELKIGNNELRGIKDSKLLSQQNRNKLDKFIRKDAIWSIARVENNIIDKINIHQATLLAMRRAVEKLYNKLCQKSVFIAVDGKFCIPKINLLQEAIVDGDNKVISIAAASIIAKVYRDKLMEQYHKFHPLYDFAKHKGYGTLHHRKMIIKHGLCPIHRVSFCRNFI